MKIGILGSGDVGKSLANGFLKYKHQVTIGTLQYPAKLADWKKQNPSGNIASFADTAKSADVIVLAVKGTVASEALQSRGRLPNLDGKIIIDANVNPIADAPPVNGILKFFTDINGIP